jgi:hypothetical protein
LTLCRIREEALIELTNRLNVETEQKISSLIEKYSLESQEMKREHELVLRETIESLKEEQEENLRIERLTHEREMDQLRASHADELNQLREEKDAVQEQLSKVEAM